MEIKWFGTASVGIEDNGKSILIDPFYNRNPDLPCATKEDFAAYDSILLTHGHYDHIVDVPEIIRDSKATVYCTATPAKTLRKMGVNGTQIKIIKPESRLSINGFEIDVYRSKHVVFDKSTILEHAVSLNFYRKFSTAMKILSTTVTMPEAGEIVAYHIHTSDDDAFVLGSLNYDTTVTYPKRINTLILPYNGCSKLEQVALSITEMLAPANVLLDHYDNSFPPITTEIDTGVFTTLMETRHPEIDVQCLKFCETSSSRVSTQLEQVATAKPLATIA